jgi:hypothetical protein
VLLGDSAADSIVLYRAMYTTHLNCPASSPEAVFGGISAPMTAGPGAALRAAFVRLEKGTSENDV